MKPIKFNDKQVDTRLFLNLQDLVSILSGLDDVEFQYAFGSYIDTENNTITASHFWDNYPEKLTDTGLKSDIYLRTLGTLRHTNEQLVKRYKEEIAEFRIKKFSAQLFSLLEDMRIEEICKKERPGTKRIFEVRRNTLYTYFKSQLSTNITRSFALDELFCLIYLELNSPLPNPVFSNVNLQQEESLNGLKSDLFAIYDVRSTQEVINICYRVIYKCIDRYKTDCLNEYFVLPYYHDLSGNHYSFQELKRVDSLINDDTDDVEESEADILEEKFSTWHRENSDNETTQSFLRFELESGTKTSLMGEGVRETEEGDQTLASIQGKSQQSKGNDYSKVESLEKESSKQEGKAGSTYGEENRNAVLLIKEPVKPGPDDLMEYNDFKMEVETYQKKLSSYIEKTLEYKQISPRKDMQFGRLSKKLVPIACERLPRVFYKKNSTSKEIDAVFSLLVDCSASMHDKMTETKKGITLFHEVLKQLKIPHAISGFWEDANAVKEGYQPNYLHQIKTFENSLQHASGAEILQLEPQEDNRDGFSIRVAQEELERRSEKHKFLLVFSDGEPAAAQYDQNGIIDTHEAVLLARRKGTEVIGLFLANGNIDESDEKTMLNIYGKEHVLVPTVQDLPEQFSPLLKKLILKTI